MKTLTFFLLLITTSVCATTTFTGGTLTGSSGGGYLLGSYVAPGNYMLRYSSLDSSGNYLAVPYNLGVYILDVSDPASITLDDNITGASFFDMYGHSGTDVPYIYGTDIFTISGTQYLFFTDRTGTPKGNPDWTQNTQGYVHCYDLTNIGGSIVAGDREFYTDFLDRPCKVEALRFVSDDYVAVFHRTGGVSLLKVSDPANFNSSTDSQMLEPKGYNAPLRYPDRNGDGGDTDDIEVMGGCIAADGTYMYLPNFGHNMLTVSIPEGVVSAMTVDDDYPGESDYKPAFWDCAIDDNGDSLYVSWNIWDTTESAGLRSFDVRDPGTIAVGETVTVTNDYKNIKSDYAPLGVNISGDWVFMGNGYNGLEVFDVSTTYAIEHKLTINFSERCVWQGFVNGNRLYVIILRNTTGRGSVHILNWKEIQRAISSGKTFIAI